MTKRQFIDLVKTVPKSTRAAVILADANGISFKRRNAHLRAWFGLGRGNLLPSGHNLKG